MSVERINPGTLAPSTGYTHVVKDGHTIYIAGQVARDLDGNTVGVGDVGAQAEQVFKNLQAALASVGGNLGQIVKMTTFMTHREDFQAYRAVRSRYLPGDSLPTSTLILCSGLAEPEYRIEIEAIAVVP